MKVQEDEEVGGEEEEIKKITKIHLLISLVKAFMPLSPKAWRSCPSLLQHVGDGIRQGGEVCGGVVV